MSVNIRGIVKCSLIAVLASLLLIFILSLLTYFTDIGGGFIKIASYAAVMIGAFLGAFLAAKAAQSRKLLNALIVCAVYAAVLAGVSIAMRGSVTFNGHMAAVLGGIFASALLASVAAAR